MSDYGCCDGIVGADLDTLDRLMRMPDLAPLSAPAAIPQMWRPFKGGATVTQSFGNRHYGVDFGIPTGTPIYACHAGQVVIARQDSTGYGWVIAIKNDALGVYTVYGHLNYAAGIVVRAGQQVSERQHIGYSDNTGNSTGPHLHLELRVPPYGYPGACINPLPYLRVWDDAPAPTPAGNQYRALGRVKVIKKNTGKVVGQHPAGAILTLGGATDDGRHYYCPAQLGVGAGFVPVGKVVRL